jgi:hypothetical protein
MRRPLSRNRRAEVKTRPGRRLGVGTMTGRASPTLRAAALSKATGVDVKRSFRSATVEGDGAPTSERAA